MPVLHAWSNYGIKLLGLPGISRMILAGAALIGTLFCPPAFLSGRQAFASVLDDVDHAVVRHADFFVSGADPVARSARKDETGVSASPRRFGAIGDGMHHPARQALGVTGLADLAAYATPDGKHPYGWVSSYPHGVLFNLPVSAAALPGTARLVFAITRTTGLIFNISARSNARRELLVFANLYGVYSGVTVSGRCIVPGTRVQSRDDVGGVVLDRAPTCDVDAGTPITFDVAGVSTSLMTEAVPGRAGATSADGLTLGVRAKFGLGSGRVPPGSRIVVDGSGADFGACGGDPSAGTVALCSPAPQVLSPGVAISLFEGWSVYLTDVTGVYQGMLVSGSSIPDMVTVEYVNPSTSEVRFSRPVGAQAGAILDFHWPMSAVTAGMQVIGPGVAPGTTVKAVDGGSVVLTSPLASIARPASGTSAADTALRGTPITFYRPFTDGEAGELEMDTLGIMASIEAAKEAGGGLVKLGAGHYRIDQTLVFPTFPDNGTERPAVSLAGEGEDATFLEAVGDLGPDTFVLSCGDPTGTPENGRGIYERERRGVFCSGHWRDLHIETLGFTPPRPGARPIIAGRSVAMSGVRHGPRREMDNVVVEGFNNGIDGQSDHTRLNFVTSRFNFIGERLGPAMTDLFGDNDLDHVFFAANGWAALSVAADAFWNGVMIKPYFGFNPYAIWCEPGLGVEMCVQGSSILEPNWEGVGCGTIIDGNISPDAPGLGARRSIVETSIEGLYTSGVQGNFVPGGGCLWAAYIDLLGASGLSITNIWSNTFPVVPNARSLIRLARGSSENGGIHLSGSGMHSLIKEYAANCQEMVTGGRGVGSEFWFTGGDDQVLFDQPGEFTAKPIGFVDPAKGALRRGTVLESVRDPPRLDGRRADAAHTGTALEGLTLADYPCDMHGRFVVVATSGRRLPVAVNSPTALGTLLRLGHDGSATAASSASDAQLLGIVVGSDSGSATTVFMQSLFAGAH